MKTRQAYCTIGERVVAQDVPPLLLRTATLLAYEFSVAAELEPTLWQAGNSHIVERVCVYNHTTDPPFKYDGIHFRIIRTGEKTPRTSLAVAVNGPKAYAIYERPFTDDFSRFVDAGVLLESVAHFAEDKGYVARVSLAKSVDAVTIGGASISAEFRRKEFLGAARAIGHIDSMISAYLACSAPKRKMRK